MTVQAQGELPPAATPARAACAGVVALPARLEGWQIAVCNRPAQLNDWLELHGSPLNILDPEPFARNARELQNAAALAGIELEIFFARKANKALTFVDEALRLGLGIDVASEQELRQALERGVTGRDVMVTAAIKPRALLEASAAAAATVVIDNEDELRLLAEVARSSPRTVPVALRLAPALAGGREPTRFGLAFAELLSLVERHWHAGATAALEIKGVHFHLDGYAADDRVGALQESLELIDALRERGHCSAFVDIGGGIPISYLDDAEDWDRFWSEHRSALTGEREPLTFAGHGLGLTAHGGEILGRPAVYPSDQELTRGRWLSHVLAAVVSTRAGRHTVADALRARDLQLRCEPGRSLLDGCGLTAARVEFRKQRPDGTWLIGVAMNRTQCRSTADEFLVDPLLLRTPQSPDAHGTGGMEGYLVGAYCIERELLTWRRLRFPQGVDVGDIVVFPNTAGYLMHILESASHQIPLARNIVTGDALSEPFIDPIDRLP